KHTFRKRSRREALGYPRSPAYEGLSKHENSFPRLTDNMKKTKKRAKGRNQGWWEERSTQRKPMFPAVNSGGCLTRFAERRSWNVSWKKDPPRKTRSLPVLGPEGFSCAALG